MVLINQQPYLAQDIWLRQKPTVNENQREQYPIKSNFSNHMFNDFAPIFGYLKLAVIL